MAFITFGDIVAGDMGSDELTVPPFSSFFPSLNFDGPDIISQGPMHILARDPFTGTTLEIQGLFDFTSEAAFFASSVTRIVAKTSANAPIVDVGGFSITLAQALEIDLNVMQFIFAGADTITGAALGDRLLGFGGNDQIFGNAGTDTLEGGAGNDHLFGGAEADQLKGGPGNDTYHDVESSDILSELPGQGIDSVMTSVTFTLPENFESLFLMGSDSINGTGNDLDNHFLGNSAPNVFTGGKGNDTYEPLAGDTIVELPGEGVDTIRTDIDNFPLPDNVENLVLEGNAIAATGNDTSNALTGTSGNNELDGGRGIDAMAGLLGNDSYHVDCFLDAVTEALSGGLDEIVSVVSMILPANVENALAASGVSLVNLVGNVLNNLLTGNNSGNLLDGGAGNDTLNGGPGDDTLVGGDGNDTLIGGDGSDVLLGGTGADLFRFDQAPDGGNVDRVMDFVAGTDDLQFAGGVFAALSGNFAEEFVKGPGVQALEADDHLLYDTAIGRLYYDADGSGAGDAQLVATFQGAPNINAADLHVA
jgi:Ca2+-binding RTX toxin-like protein